MWKVVKYTIYDIIRNKIILSYTVFLLLMNISLFMLDTDPSKSLSSVMSVMLIVVPLVSIIFSTIFIYNSYEFTELLVAQPINRNHILLANYLGLATSLVVAFLIGAALPVFIYAPGTTGTFLVMIGILLTLIFIAIAFLSSLTTRDKAKGIGTSLLLWFFFSVVYDGLLIGCLFFFSEYPLEKAVLIITAFNPIDLGRISILMKMDISALMGYTGAVYQHFFGSGSGMVYTVIFLILWAIFPLTVAIFLFRRKDL